MEMGDSRIKHLYFIALLAPQEIDRMAQAWKFDLKERYGCKVALKSQAHITLIPPFSMHPELEAEVMDFLRTFASSRAQVSFSLNGFDHFGHRTIYIAVEKNPELQQLQSRLQHLFRDQFPGFHLPLHKDFHPHLTLANRDIPAAAFPVIFKTFENLSYTASGIFETITLLRLEQGRWVSAGQADFLKHC